MRRIFRYFFQGLLYVVPLAIVVYVVFNIFVFVGNLVRDSGIAIHPAVDPILAIVAFILVISAIGLLGGTILFKPLFIGIEAIIEKAPLINIFYTAVKDLMEALIGGPGKKYNTPVLVKMGNAPGVEKIGFITREDLSELGIEATKVAVYFPHSFNFSGNLFIVAKENISPIDSSASDVMKFVVSGGVTGIVKD